jgi:hypothetical protein
MHLLKIFFVKRLFLVWFIEENLKKQWGVGRCEWRETHKARWMRKSRYPLRATRYDFQFITQMKNIIESKNLMARYQKAYEDS